MKIRIASARGCLLIAMGVATGLAVAGQVDKVVVEDPFWSPKFALWRTVTIPDVLDKLEKRSGAIENLDRAARRERGGHRGAPFFDGLLFETVRGASDYLAARPDPALEQRLKSIVPRIVAAQESDGYLNTTVQLGHPDWRWGDNGGCMLEQHEIYNAGCLLEAGLHYYRATGGTALLAAGVKFANLMCDTMGPLPKRNLIPTHSLAEEAMVKLVRLCRREPGLGGKLGVPVRPDDYLALVKFWFDNHGRHCGAPEWESHGSHQGGGPKAMALVHEMTKTPHGPEWRPCWGDYQMDRIPLADYRSIEGHAVRTALLCTGLAAYAAETGDASSAALATRFWESMVGRKMYVTGGIGARSDFERFGDDWELPPDAYLETCAAAASAFFSGWMAERTGEGRYMDEFERVIYNALLTAVGEDGCHYTYQNPLNTAKGERWEWHGCPCCPPMFLKLTGAIPDYIYAGGDKGLTVNLFIGSSASVRVGASRVAVRQTSTYTDDGRVRIEVDPGSPATFDVRVRIPGWARGVENPFGLYTSDGKSRYSIALNGKPVDAKVEAGYAVVRRAWAKGDGIELRFDVSPRKIVADPRVRATAGLAAWAKGPVVLAEEDGEVIPYWRVANRGPRPHRVWR